MIERHLVRLSLVVVLLAVSFGAFSLMQTSPAQAAETLVPMYGCPATLDGSPIGGGEGCTTLYTAAGADYVATTAAQLKTDLAAAAPGEIVYVADGATLTITKAAGSTHYSDTQLVYVPAWGDSSWWQR